MKHPMKFRPFYPGDCRQQIAAFLENFAVDESLPALRAAAVPHAGWRYSGAVAARALKTLASTGPQTLLLFGAVHRYPLSKPAVYSRGAWDTPLGGVAVDDTLAEEILARLPEKTETNFDAYREEHSLEVVMPMIRELFAEAKVVPIMIPPEPDAARLGEDIAAIVGDRPVGAIASTDLTHYGPTYGFTPAGLGEEGHDWMRANDQRIIDRALNLKAEEIVPEAKSYHNACGSGALAAAVAYARARGSEKGYLIERTDSHEAQDPTAPFDMAVGYAGMVF